MYNQINNVQVQVYRNNRHEKSVYDTVDTPWGSGATVSGSSPASDAGLVMILRIFVGALGVCSSGTIDPERDGAVDITTEPRDPVDLSALPDAGADIDATDFRMAFAVVGAEAVVTGSGSSSPTHKRVNQRPLAMPRITRFAFTSELKHHFYPKIARVPNFGGG